MKEKIIIDAEALAEKIVLHQRKVGILETYHERALEGVREDIAQLITSSIDLNITWVDTKSSTEGGQYEAVHCGLRALISENVSTKQWHWSIFGWDGEIIGDWVDTKELAQQESEKALKRIISGVKE